LKKNKKPECFAFTVAIGGLAFMFALITVLQGPIHRRPKKEVSSVEFKVKKKKANPQQKLAKKKPKPRKVKTTRKTLKPRLDLAFASGGIDLGIDILGLSAGDSSLLGKGDTVMTEDVVDQLPQVQHRDPIPFPELALEKGIDGYVTVNVLVNKKGSVEKVKLLEAHPEGIFEQAALNGVRGWNFSPAEYQGRLVSVWIKQKVRFQVN